MCDYVLVINICIIIIIIIIIITRWRTSESEQVCVATEVVLTEDKSASAVFGRHLVVDVLLSRDSERDSDVGMLTLSAIVSLSAMSSQPGVVCGDL